MSIPPSTMPNILVVDDEKDIRDLIVLNLDREGFDSIEAADGLEALKRAKSDKPDLIILDLMLPQKDGITVYRELQENSLTNSIPIIMLTARGKLEEKIGGLEIGADDYIIKPFSPRELMLRVRNLLRRTLGAGQADVVEIGEFRLDKKHLKLHVGDEPVDLTTTEFKLLLVLAETPGIVKERAELLQKVWGYNDLIQTRTLDTHIKRLREKLETHGSQIETIRGVGYRLKDPAKTVAGE